MVFIVREDHKGHLQFLTRQPIEVIESFCRLSIGILNNEDPSPKAYENAAQKLETESEVIKASVQALAHLFIEASRQKCDSIEFQDTLLTIGFNSDIQDVIVKTYLENNVTIRSALNRFTLDIPHYKDLDWRVEMQVSSRSLLHEMQPNVTLRLTTNNQSGNKQYGTVETDVKNLIHITETLEQALLEARGQYFRKVQRVIK